MGGVDSRKLIGLFKKKNKNKNGSIWSIFMHADVEDWFLMVLGTIGAIGEGFTFPLILYISSRMINNIGSSSTMEPDTFIHNINKVFNSLSLLTLTHIFRSSLTKNYLFLFFSLEYKINAGNRNTHDMISIMKNFVGNCMMTMKII
jgi:hypothetical protein